MYEKKHHRLLSRKAFQARLFRQLCLVSTAILASLALGVLGYRYTEDMAWLDALLNASMILGGMGPVDILHTDGGKWFASFYSIYCGIFLIICGGLLFAPVFHRILHHFHEKG